MIRIDGSRGEGGGQIVRSSLALALVTGQTVSISNVRARRPRPGLMRQHLTALQAAAEIGRAHVDGAAVGSSEIVFRPAAIHAGNYVFSIGTAGSTMLVLQTILPALMVADGPSRIVLEGGTHNPFAPPFDYLARAFAPLIAQMGPRIELTLERHGFYPAGGGRVVVNVTPVERPGSLSLLRRGLIQQRTVRALVSSLPKHVGERECRRVVTKLEWQARDTVVEEVADPIGPGNVLFVEIESEHVVEVFSAFGEKGRRAEAVADACVADARRYLAADVPVGEYLADQLLLPLGISAALGGGGGEYRTLSLSRHATTHIDVLREFLPVAIDVQETGADNVVVTVRKS